MTNIFDKILQGHIDPVKNILKDISINTLDNATKFGLLYTAVLSRQTDMVDIILQYGVDINIKLDINTNVLFTAISMHDIKMLKHLLKKGVDPNVVNMYGQSVLSLTIETNKDPQYVKLLILYGARK